MCTNLEGLTPGHLLDLSKLSIRICLVPSVHRVVTGNQSVKLITWFSVVKIHCINCVPYLDGLTPAGFIITKDLNLSGSLNVRCRPGYDEQWLVTSMSTLKYRHKMELHNLEKAYLSDFLPREVSSLPLRYTSQILYSITRDAHRSTYMSICGVYDG